MNKISSQLSDLVMMQMLGTLSEYIMAVERGDYGGAQGVVEKTSKRASMPHIFRDVVSRTARSQFGDPYASARELVQNGLDAYKPGELKKVEFNFQGDYNRGRFSCRDFGRGMDTATVVRYLLIPYNTTKENDEESIGEHGIGWFSILGISDNVEVTTGNGKTTKVRIARDGDDWKVDLEVEDGKMRGTEVALDVVRDSSRFKESLEKHAGFVDPNYAQINFDGEPINTKAKDYKVFGDVSTDRGIKFGVRKSHDRDIFLTQKGLLVSDQFRGPFGSEDGIHYSLFEQLRRDRVTMWMDLPLSIGLTRGRKDISPQFAKDFKQLAGAAFEETMIGLLTEQEEGEQWIDLSFSDYVDRILDCTFVDTAVKEGKARTVGGSFLERVGLSKSSTSDSIGGAYGKNHLAELDAPKNKDVIVSYAGKNRFAQRLMSARFIKGISYVDGNATPITLSIIDLMEAYHKGELLQSKFSATNGLWVEGSVVYKIINRHRDKEVTRVDSHRPLRINPTPAKTLKISKDGKGVEYLAFLETAQYMEDLISVAAGMGRMLVMLDYNSDGNIDRIACTNGSGVTFNIGSWTIQRLIYSIQEGNLDEHQLIKLIDVEVHEKAHQLVMETHDASSHGDKFWEAKRKLRRAFGTYNADRDIEGDVKKILGQYNFGEPMSVKELAELIGK